MMRDLLIQLRYEKESFNYPLTNIEKNNIIIKINLLEKENYEDNEVIGNMVIKLKDKELKKIDIFIKKEIKKSLFQKIKEWISKLW